ncbi:MAG: GIY-YIG nuclease family protein [Gammaproteobacteria bacterium]
MMSNPNNKVLYTGVTNNLERRVYEHKTKQLEGFTKKYNCTKLVYFEVCGNMIDAITREKQIKGWKRIKKNNLVESLNPQWNDLAGDWFEDI